MKVVEREAAEAAPAKERRRISLPVFGSFSLRPALVGFGIALLLVAGVAGYSLRDGAGAERRQLRRDSRPSKARSPPGRSRSTGDEGTLTVASLPQVHGDDVYQAWVQTDGQGGKIVPSSLFAVHDDGSGEVAIPHGLDGADARDGHPRAEGRQREADRGAAAGRRARVAPRRSALI